MERSDQTADDLDRPSGQYLEAAYEHHDVGERLLYDAVHEQYPDARIVPWGLDMRGDGGNLIYDDAMDLVVYLPVDKQASAISLLPDSSDVGDAIDTNVDDILDPEDTPPRYYCTRDRVYGCVAAIDVKTKTSARWMGLFNKRHYDAYANHAANGVAPFVGVVMYLLDGDGGADDAFVLDLPSDAPMVDSDTHDSVRSFPDGNTAVYVPSAARTTLPSFIDDFTIVQSLLEDVHA